MHRTAAALVQQPATGANPELGTDVTVAAVIDGHTVARLGLDDASMLAAQLADQVEHALEAGRTVDDAERQPFTGECPPFCQARHQVVNAALNDYHHQPLGSIGVSWDPLMLDLDGLENAVQVELIQHVTRDPQAYVAIDDGSDCMRFTADQARALAARLLQGAAILDQQGDRDPA